MPLIFAGLTPHPPLLIPNIGKDQLAKLEQTKKAMEKLEEELYIAKPNIIVVISPHSSLFPESFTVNAHTNFTSSFEEFGDLSTKKVWPGSPELASKIASYAKKEELPIQLVSQERLDHGATVPLFYLTNHLPDVKVIAIGYSSLSPEQHVKFGYMLKDVFMEQDKRIALIASGDMSHLDAPDDSSLHEQHRTFDESIISLLEAKDLKKFEELDNSYLKKPHECGYRSLLIAMGVLKNMDFDFKLYSYEYPFGIGYMVGQFAF